jgi:putative aldouronate transport system substrate-binding protein
MINGYPKYTDLILNNPDMGVDVALGQYTRAVYNGAMLVDLRYLEQYYKLPQQQDAWKKWGKTKALEHALPSVTPTQQESEQLASIISEINTYIDEMFVKFATGQEPLSNFEQYLAQLKTMGAEKAIAIQQAAYSRYLAR